MECLNVSSLWKLPLVFICEHNKFSEFTPAAQVTSGEIVNRARAFGIPTYVVDGNDALAVWDAAAQAIGHARSGEGPAFVEAHTYRIQGHLEAEDLMLGGGKYREKSEIESWIAKDPLERLKKTLVADGRASAQQLQAIEARVASQVEAAVKFAEESEPADPELPFELMFVGRRA
jgi:pyruvate dehydrogenase E1 component alpha subunit